MRKKSSYKPRPVLLDTLQHVRVGMQKADTSNGEIRSIRIRNHLALASIMTLKPTLSDLSVLTQSFNVAISLAVQGLEREAYQDLFDASDAIERCALRGEVTADDAEDVRAGLVVHDRQLDLATVKQIEIAIKFKRERNEQL